MFPHCEALEAKMNENVDTEDFEDKVGQTGSN
jgi:hypothetical protein